MNRQPQAEPIDDLPLWAALLVIWFGILVAAGGVVGLLWLLGMLFGWL